jgi:hypothetical protein
MLGMDRLIALWTEPINDATMNAFLIPIDRCPPCPSGGGKHLGRRGVFDQENLDKVYVSQ